jgi:prepilin signal peptidase PulO-like enzyme (type II secretory pathway)
LQSQQLSLKRQILILFALSGAIIGSCLLIRGGKNFKTQLPFGPYIIGASFLYILIGPQLIKITELLLLNIFL